jgi:hypothetical protein
VGSPFPSVALLTADAPGVLTQYPPLWGVFQQNGAPALVSDSVASVDYSREYSVSDYPQEQGAFASYNKVQQPFDSNVTILSSLTRQQLLNTLEPIVASLALVSVVTPEVSYPSANLTGYKLRRTMRSGVTLISVDLSLKEIRVTATTASAGTQRPVGQVNSGSNLVAPPTSTGASPTAQLGTGTIQPLSDSATTPANLAAGTGAFTVPAINIGSTNGATPTNSGPVQPIGPPLPDDGVVIEGFTITPLTPPN